MLSSFSVVAMGRRVAISVAEHAHSSESSPFSPIHRYLNVVDVVTVIALVVSAVTLTCACWLAVRAAAEMSKSDSEHELHQGQKCAKYIPQPRVGDRLRRKAG